MLSFWLRNLMLWGSHLVGAIRSFLQRRVVIHLIILMVIAGGLWLTDETVAVWFRLAETAKGAVSAFLDLAEKTPTARSKEVVSKQNEQASDHAGEQASSAPSKNGLPQQHIRADERAPKPALTALPKGESSNQPKQVGEQIREMAQPVPAKADTSTQEKGGGDQSMKKASSVAPKVETPKQGKEAGARAERKPWLTLWNVLSIWAFGLVAWWVVKARRRLVIGAFEDHSDKQSGIDAGGFGVLVATELASLSDLFSEFEEGRNIQSISEKMEPINSTFQTESTSDFLQNTVSAETKFSLGPLQIPVGIILSLVGKLVQGPRITGQLHRDAGQRMITVRLLGSLGDRVWSVVDPALVVQADKAVWRSVAEVAHDLACRLFAELAMDHSVTWQALSQFVAGVRAYRRSLQTPKQRKLNLKEAEHRLLQARSEDPNFDLAEYNLGVVYNELGRLEAAGTAFTRAAEKDNRRRGTYYALALVNRNLAQQAFQQDEQEAAKLYLSKSIDLCDQALDLAPPPEEAAQILALKAIVLWWRGWRMWSDQPATQYREFRSAGVMARHAIWRAWEVLCRAELGFGISAREKPSALEHARKAASRHLQNRSSMLLEVARLQASLPPGPAAARAAEVRDNLRSSEHLPGFRGMIVRSLFRCAMLSFEVASQLTYTKIIRRMALREATYMLRQARSLTPAEASVYLDLGKAFLNRNKNKSAISALRAAARLSPTSSDSWGFLALAYARCDRRDQAFEASLCLLGNVSGATEESFESLAVATETLKRLYVQIQEFTSAIPHRFQAMSRFGFKLWSVRRFLQFAYRLAGRDLRGLQGVNEELTRLISTPDQLQAKIDSFDKARDRARRLTQFAAEIKVLSDKGEEGIEPLMALLSEKQAEGHNWEVGEVGHRLGLLYLSLDKLAEAESCLRDTIGYLEKSIHAELQRRGLHTLLARILRTQGKHPAALEQARNGVARDPMSPYERTELGWAHLNLGEYRSAQSVWEDALLLVPEDPQLHMNLGLAHLGQKGDSKDKAAQSAHLELATRHINTALELFDDSHPARNGARFVLSQVYAAAGDYADAVRELRILDQSDYCGLAVSIELADAHLANEDWVEAERRFRQAAAEIDQRILIVSKGVNELLESPPGGEHVLGTASAFAHLGIAASLLEREIYLDQALAEVARARAVLKDLSNAKLKEQWEGRCTFHEGLILSRQDRTDDAIAKLEAALAASADAATYFALANALARKGELTIEPAIKTQIVRRATRCYQEAQRLDWNGVLELKINKALAQLQAVTAK